MGPVKAESLFTGRVEARFIGEMREADGGDGEDTPTLATHYECGLRTFVTRA